jgi:hypothetical protein
MHMEPSIESEIDDVREPSRELLNNLILGVCHLCDRTRALARSGSTDPVSITPVREAVQMVSTTLEALCSTWARTTPAAVFSDAGQGAPRAEWPFGNGSVDIGRRGQGDE